MRLKPFSSRFKIRLGSMRDVRREMCVCYREAAAGRLPWPDFTRAMYGLRIIAETFTGSAADERLTVLEYLLAAPAKSNGSHQVEYRQ
jgi:hypothetical protein